MRPPRRPCRRQPLARRRRRGGDSRMVRGPRRGPWHHVRQGDPPTHLCPRHSTEIPRRTRPRATRHRRGRRSLRGLDDRLPRRGRPPRSRSVPRGAFQYRRRRRLHGLGRRRPARRHGRHQPPFPQHRHRRRGLHPARAPRPRLCRVGRRGGGDAHLRRRQVRRLPLRRSRQPRRHPRLHPHRLHAALRLDDDPPPHSPRTRGSPSSPSISAGIAQTSASSRSGERPDDSPSGPKSHISSSSAWNTPACRTRPCA